MSKHDIGLVGLAVMGQNLVMNMANKGFSVGVYNRTVETTHEFINGLGSRRRAWWNPVPHRGFRVTILWKHLSTVLLRRGES